MFNVVRQEIEWGGRPLIIETGKIARQGDGAVTVTYGETVVLCVVVADPKVKEGVDFFPLTVNYQDRYAAAGRIPGGYIKREGRPSEKEILTCRLIDRPIRPLFPNGFYNETQVTCTLLSHDGENDADILSIIGTSAALAISGIPFLHTIAAARIAYIDNEFVLNPTFAQVKTSQLELVVAGTKEGVLMVESEAKELSEETMLDAVMYAQKHFLPVIKMIEKLAKEVGKPRWEPNDTAKIEKKVFDKVKKLAEKGLRAAYKINIKQDRVAQIDEVRDNVLNELYTDEAQAEGITELLINSQFKKLEQEIVRGDILEKKVRIDGRDPTQIRPITCEVGFLPRVHGSALFTRGETQALVIATLGTSQDEQSIDAIEGELRERFMLHYNFPPYSVGEVGRVGSPGRREIGHGKLAWRAMNPIIPDKSEFPYTIRILSEITESNGSSSMATVCGASLSMMDAGIPLQKPVAGIAMGLIKEGEKFTVISDILGDEDHLGDMDFKVAGTVDGVTSLQMDIKITSITREIMEQALKQAKDGRLSILKEMGKAITHSRDKISANAPRIHSMQINKDKIRDLIGPGGKVIREICDVTGTRIDISEEGLVEVSGPTQQSIELAEARILQVVGDVEVGLIFKGRVTRILDFGAIVTFMGERTGMVHISQLSSERVKAVSDIVKEGDEVFVKVIEVEDRGKIKLSMKVLDQQTGQEVSA
jgi:polyribonucleotide nucleotidyltransferase